MTDDQKRMPSIVLLARAISGLAKQRGFSAKSTATEAQRQRIVEALRRRPQTSYDLRRLGCYQCAARVKELRDRFGYRIDTHRITLVDRDGYSHPRAALYCLISEPMKVQP